MCISPSKHIAFKYLYYSTSYSLNSTIFRKNVVSEKGEQGKNQHRYCPGFIPSWRYNFFIWLMMATNVWHYSYCYEMNFSACSNCKCLWDSKIIYLHHSFIIPKLHFYALFSISSDLPVISPHFVNYSFVVYIEPSWLVCWFELFCPQSSVLTSNFLIRLLRLSWLPLQHKHLSDGGQIQQC